MMDYLNRIFDPSGFMPRRSCGQWTLDLILLHNLSDALIFASYMAISVLLIHFCRNRLDAPFRPVLWLFGAFIFFCGLTHFLEIVVFYSPLYRLMGVVKLATALISVVTVVALIRAVPGAMVVRGVQSLEMELEQQWRVQEVAGARTRQLEVLIELSRRALAKAAPEALAGMVASLLARGLGVNLCGIFRALPGEPDLQLEAGVGWRVGTVGNATVPAGVRSLAGFIARQSEVVVSPALENENRFEVTDLERSHDVSGGLGVEVQGPTGSCCVLVAYTTGPESFEPAADAPRPPLGDDDVWFLRSVAAVFGTNLVRLEAERVLVTLATTDALTGLHNFRYLHKESRAVEKRAARDGRTLSAVMIDVDRFKGYNDTFGHSSGDEVLRDVGGILRREARAGDLVARYGGEEFAILLPGAEASEALEFADRLRRAISSYPWPLRPVTASLGVATGEPSKTGALALLARADRALFVAKRAGRNRVEFDKNTVEGEKVAEPRDAAQAEEPGPAGAEVLHIDDDPAYLRVLGQHLSQAGFHVRQAESWAEGLALASDGPDLIILDILLPDGDGLEVCRKLKAGPATAAIPILALSGGLHSGADRALALASGASAALSKSADLEELLAVASALVRDSRASRDLCRSLQEMGDRLGEQAHQMERSCDATIEGWARLLELRDHETEGHSRRVTELTVQLARRMGLNDDATLVQLRRGALLHDIGKIGVPDAILGKAGPLDESEWDVMRRHPELARQMLEPIGFLLPALAIPYGHHERWDGKGYPEGLRGEEIPISARIFTTADIHDALSHDRPYRLAWSPERVIEHIRSLSGTHLDPKVVDVYLALLTSGKEGDSEVEPDLPESS
jgi:putative two-component system response regulator